MQDNHDMMDGARCMYDELDLVDQMQWEDHPSIIWLTLEEAGLENQDYDTIPSSQWFGYYEDEDGAR